MAKKAYIGNYNKIPRWVLRDIQDMKNSRQTSFKRCPKCNRVHDTGYCCPYCGNTYDGE